jgi:hypothetical protein
MRAIAIASGVTVLVHPSAMKLLEYPDSIQGFSFEIREDYLAHEDGFQHLLEACECRLEFIQESINHAFA